MHYEYNKAGNVRKMWGEKQGNNYAYIDYIGYDAFEQRTYLKHGNGVESRYTFDPLMHRLQQLKVDTPHRNIISNTYTYDAVSNILSVSNTATAQVSQDLGGSSTQNFEYDGFYRLKKANGSFQGFQRNAAFTLEMEYNAMNSITHKKLHHTLDGAMPANTNYHLAYDYTQAEGTPAHAVKRLVQSPYQDPATLSEITEMKYDANGNLTEQTQGLHYKLMNWDEENRLQSVNNDGNVSLYTYDASGERVIKSNGNNQNLFIDGAPVAVLAHNDNYTTYVSSFMTAQKERFTKHYYIGSQRVVSKIGSGKFSSQFDNGMSLTAGNINFSEAIAQNTQAINNYLASLGIPPGPAAAQGAYAPLPVPQTPEGNMSNDQPPLGWPQNPAFNPPGGVPGPPVQFGTPTTNANVQPGYGYTGTGALIENDIYYFHSDHLGSTSYLTNKQGNVSQHVEYIPFGETLIENHLNNQNNPYLYNGKELDAETGFYYYGARYYEPKMSLWLSVDPLAEKYPGFSPYNYTFNNPINFVDPTGMAGEDWDDIIIRTKNLVGDGYTEYARIPTTNFDVTFDLNIPTTSGVVTRAPLPIFAPGKCTELGKTLDALVALKGKPDAISLSLTGALAYKGGVGFSLTTAAFLDGPDKGKLFNYTTLSAHEGLEASIGLEFALVYSEVPIKKFDRGTLAGWGEGVQAAKSFLGTSAFQGFEWDLSVSKNKYGIPNGIDFVKNILYTGESISVNLGPSDITYTGSAFIGYSELLGEHILTIK